VEFVHTAPHTVNVLVEYDGESVHWPSRRVATSARVADVETPYARATGERLEQGEGDEPDRTVVRARMDDRPAWKTLDLGTPDAPCYVVMAQVDTVTQEGRPNLTLSFSANCLSGEEGGAGTTTTRGSQPPG